MLFVNFVRRKCGRANKGLALSRSTRRAYRPNEADSTYFARGVRHGLVECSTSFLNLTYCFDLHLPGCVTCGWAGGDNAVLTEPASSHANCLKTRRLPPVGCTRCWRQIAISDQADSASMISWQNSGRSSGTRPVMMLPSLTAALSTYSAPAFTKSSLTPT